MFRNIRRAFFLAAILGIAFALPARAAEHVVNLTLIVFSDIYEMSEKDGRGGFARIAGALKAERAKAKNVIVAHAGDTLSPSLMSSLDKGAHIIELLNGAGLDVFTPGNHEFDFGEAIFRQRMSEAKFPLLAANLRDNSDNLLPGFADSKIFEIEGVKIGRRIRINQPDDANVRCKVSGASAQHKDFSPFTQQPTTRSTFNAISFQQGRTELFEPRPWTHGVRPLLQHEHDHQRDHSRLSFDNVTKPAKARSCASNTITCVSRK